MVFENVPEYADSASSQILRHQLRDMGYVTHEAILKGADYGCLEGRIRWCMVAVTKGLDFSFDEMAPKLTEVKVLGDYLDDIPPDSPKYTAMSYLKTKEARDAEKGNSFSMQFVTPESTKVPTIRKGYHKGGSTDPYLRHPTDPELSRKFTGAEHARIKEVPEHLVEGLSETQKHELLGQGIVYAPFNAVGKRLAEHLLAFARDYIANQMQDRVIEGELAETTLTRKNRAVG